MTRARLVAACAGALCLCALFASRAAAHAVVVATSPVDGETVASAPGQVSIQFDEAVTAPVAAVRVFDGSGRRVDLGRVELAGDGTTLVAPLGDDLATGTHIVTWRAVSADGHPVKGAFVFHVGAPGAPVTESFVASLLGSSRDRPFAMAGGAGRWVSYLAVLLACGGFFFVTVIDRTDRDPILILVRTACVVGAFSAVTLVPLFAAESTGLGWSALRSAEAWQDALWSAVGVAALAAIAGFGMMLAALALSNGTLGWLAIAALIGSQLVAGHTRTTEPAWLVWTADAVHIAAASVWLGGLAGLFVMWRRRQGRDVAAVAATVGRFSTVAAWSVLALTIAGGTLAWTQVRALHAATSTPYGWTLLVKIAVAGAVLSVATYNNRVLVPVIGGGGEAPAAWARLGTTIRIEIVGLAAVLAVTAFLVNLQPAAEAAGVTGPYSTFAPFGDGEVNVVVDPNRAGINEIHLYFLTAGGSISDIDEGVTLELSLPSQDVGPIVRTPQLAGPGHFLHTGPELALGGEWQITVRHRASEFREDAATIAVVVNG